MLEPLYNWNCRNRSDLHYNTNNTFPNKILPVADQIFSFVGAVINISLLITIYIRSKRLGTTPLSSTLCANICIAQLIASANTFFLFESGKAPLEISGRNFFNGTNLYTYAALGVEDVFRVVRISFLLPIYIIRLMYVVTPFRVIQLARSMRNSGRIIFCVVIWAAALGIGGIRTYYRFTIKDAYFSGDKQLKDSMEGYDFVFLAALQLVHFIGVIVSFISVLYLIKMVIKYRPIAIIPEQYDTLPDDTLPDDTLPDDTLPDDTLPDDTLPDDTLPDDTLPDDTLSDDTLSHSRSTLSSTRKMIYPHIKSTALLLSLLFLSDLMFDVNFTLHYVLAMKQALTPGSVTLYGHHVLPYIIYALSPGRTA